MYRVFNCGIGMALFVDKSEALDISDKIKEFGMKSYIIGEVIHKKEKSSVIFV